MNLREIRLKHHYTQQQVADLINCTTVTYSRYENDIREPSIDVLISLADLYCTSVDYLIGYKSSAGSNLTSNELRLIEAAREADDRACRDALELLLRNKK